MRLPLSDTGLPLAVERGADVGSIAHRRRAIIWRTASRRYATWPILPALEELLWSIVEREFINDLVGVPGRLRRPKISFFPAGCGGRVPCGRRHNQPEMKDCGESATLQTSRYNADCVSPAIKCTAASR